MPGHTHPFTGNAGKRPLRANADCLMSMETETIVQISTPIGNALRGIVRISGPESLSILSDCIQKDITRSGDTYFSADARFQWDSEIQLPVRVYIMRAPYSYTREDVAEIHGPGRLSLLQRIMGLCVEKGARPAQPGEFTKRAFLNGRISLNQAESVMRIIHAKSVRELKYSSAILNSRFAGFLDSCYEKLKEIKTATTLAIDFEETYGETDRNRMVEILSSIRNAVRCQIDLLRNTSVQSEERNVVLAGPANAGKSSLFNAISGSGSAITDESPGTTRDVNRQRIVLDGTALNLMDTAGLKQQTSDIDANALARTSAFSAVADLIICVVDGTRAMDPDHLDLWDNLPDGPERIYAINKSDLKTVLTETMLRKILRIPSEQPVLYTSAITGQGLAELKAIVRRNLFRADHSFNPADTLLRSATDLKEAAETLDTAVQAAGDPNTPLEILDSILIQTCNLTASLTGKNFTEDVLNDIFSRFCIGK